MAAKKTKKSFHVDLPNPRDPEAPWVEYGVYASKKEALTAVRHHFGADSQGRISIISEVDNGE